MADKTVTQFTRVSSLASSDELLAYDISASTTNKTLMTDVTSFVQSNLTAVSASILTGNISTSLLSGTISTSLLSGTIPGSMLTGTVQGSLLSGSIHGSLLTNTTVAVSKLNVTGTASSDYLLRGDGVWSNQTPLNTPSSNNDYSGVLKSLSVDSSVAAGTVCYMNSSAKMIAADADSSTSTAGMIALATANISASALGNFLLQGIHSNTSYSFTAGQTLYVSTTPGAPTATIPSGTGDIVRIVGYALGTSSIYFRPDNTFIELT